MVQSTSAGQIQSLGHQLAASGLRFLPCVEAAGARGLHSRAVRDPGPQCAEALLPSSGKPVTGCKKAREGAPVPPWEEVTES